MRIEPVAFSIIMIISALLACDGSHAQDVDAEELVRQLNVAPEPESDPQIRTRGIRLNAPRANQGRVSLNTIQFEHDSARLTPESTGQLTELGKALMDNRLLDEQFVIEGHADAYGDDHYNKELSFRRANTVKNFLVGETGVDARRLRIVGRGEEAPKTDDPYDPENRRVDVVNVKAYD
jgi:outer membrane protein OmpA-like peptidoglycan-associated protein